MNESGRIALIIISIVVMIFLLSFIVRNYMLKYFQRKLKTEEQEIQPFVSKLDEDFTSWEDKEKRTEGKKI